MESNRTIPDKFAIGFQEGTCQLSCNKCAAFSKYAVRKKEVGRMDIDTAKKLMDEIAEIGGKQIQPSIYTEPFTNPDLKEIIRYCNEKSIDVNIVTNGILIDENWVDFIIHEMSPGSRISISLDAVTQSTYEKVRGNYSLKNIEDMIHLILSKRNNKTPRIGVSFTLEHDNKEERESFIEKWKTKVDSVRVDTYFDSQRKIPDEFKVETNGEYTPCTKVFDVMTIDYNGDVRVCQADAFGDSFLGNVLKEGVLNVWNGERIHELRKHHREEKFLKSDYCFSCEAGKIIVTEEEDTEEFFLKRGPYFTYYNKK